MQIQFQLAAIAPKGSREAKGNADAKAKMRTSVVDLGLLYDQDRITEFISEHIGGLIRISNVCGMKDERAWELFYDIIFLDPVTTGHNSQIQ
jgi:hypothetical protein